MTRPKKVPLQAEKETQEMTRPVKYTDYCLQHMEDIRENGNQSVFLPRSCLNEKFSLVLGDITQRPEEAVVCSTSSNLTHAPIGVSRAIREMAGREMDAELRNTRECCVGAAIKTGGYNLPAKYVIHTAGPAPQDDCNRRHILCQCIRSCLDIVKYDNIRTVAFPCIGTGGWDLSEQEAASVTMETIRAWLEEGNKNDVQQIVFCFFTEEQRLTYISEMVRVFPPVTDGEVSGLEELQQVSDNRLNYHERLASSSILCFEFSSNSTTQLHSLFHKLCQYCKKLIQSEHKFESHKCELFSNCMILQVSKQPSSGRQRIYYDIILYLDISQYIIELKLVQISDNHWQCSELCHTFQRKIAKYLTKMSYDTKRYMKCSRAKLGNHRDRRNVQELRQMKNANVEMQCQHSESAQDCHLVDPEELLSFWWKIKEPNATISKDTLWKIAEKLGSRHVEFGLRMGVEKAVTDRIVNDYRQNSLKQAFQILVACSQLSEFSLENIFREMEALDLDTYDLRKMLS